MSFLNISSEACLGLKLHSSVDCRGARLTEDTRELQRLCDRDQGAIVLRGSSGLPRGPGVILPGTDL